MTMMRCVHPLTYEGEHLLAGVIHTLVRYDEPVVAAHPDKFEPADENDHELRAWHQRALLRAGLTSAGLSAVSDGRLWWQL